MFINSKPPMLTQTTDPRVVPEKERVKGMTPLEWDARWWQWNLTTPKTDHPANGGEPKKSIVKGVLMLPDPEQSDPGKPAPTYTFTVPKNTYLHLPVNIAECSTAPDDRPDDFHPGTQYPATDAGVTQCAGQWLPLITQANVEIDGVPVKGVLDHEQKQPVFEYTVRPGIDNVYDSPPGTYRSAADSIAMMLKPLSPGKHVIHVFTAEKPFPANSNWSAEATYIVNVEP